MPVKEASPRDHSRERKARPCRGCGRELAAHVLHTHEGACLRAQVLPGQRFQINAQTIIGGRKNPQKIRRPITVEVVKRQGNGWLVRSVESGREIEAKSFQRFIDWDQFAPGLKRAEDAA